MIPRSFNSSERSVDGVGLDVVIVEVFSNRNDSDTEEWGSLTPIPPPAPLPPPCALPPPPHVGCVQHSLLMPSVLVMVPLQIAS